MDSQEQQNPDQYNRNMHKAGDRIWTGLFLLAAGFLLLIYKMGAPIPSWLFTWPMLLIAIGLFTGIRHRFTNPSWIILIGVGVFFSWDNWYPDTNIRQYIAPVIIILVGLAFILRPKKNCATRRQERRRARWERRTGWRNDWYDQQYRQQGQGPTPPTSFNTGTGSTETLEISSVFGSIKKRVLSKDFRGGEIVCFMGGAEIDLGQADIAGQIILDVTQIFGGTKLIIPPNWDLKSEIAAVFGGVEDKRPMVATAVDPNKTIILRGTSVFGGIEINSY